MADPDEIDLENEKEDFEPAVVDDVFEEDIDEELDDDLEIEDEIDDDVADTEDVEDVEDVEDEEDDTDRDEALDELEAEELELIDDEVSESLLVDEAAELRNIRREELTLNVEAQAMRTGEFVCQSCFLVKRTSQLANRKKMICADCAV